MAEPVAPDADEVATLAARGIAPLERGASGATRADEVVEHMQRLIRIAYRDDCQPCFSCELDCPENAIRVAPSRKPRIQAWDAQ